MASVFEISAQVASFLADRLSLEQLEDWSAEYSWNIHKRADDSTQALAYQVRAILNAYSNDLCEDGLRRELAIAVRPFVQLARVSVPTIPLVYGQPSVIAATANRELPIYWERERVIA
jgi:hypothetical protein